MAKFIFGDIPFDNNVLNGQLMLDVDKDHHRAVYTDQSTGTKVVLYGDNLKESATTEGFFTSGTFDKMVIKTSEGDAIFTATGAEFKAKHFNPGFAENSVGAMVDTMFGGDDKIVGGPDKNPLYGEEGNDRIFGGGGDDTIWGGNGDDVLTGGKGSDTFYAESGLGADHDRITDFHISGKDIDTLYLATEYEKISQTNHGKDTLISFADGSTLELDNVTKADFIDYWAT